MVPTYYASAIVDRKGKVFMEYIYRGPFHSSFTVPTKNELIDKIIEDSSKFSSI